MSLIPPTNTQANNVYQAGFWIMTLGGVATLPVVLPSINNANNGALAPLLIVEGVGLTLVGISQLMVHVDGSPRDKLRASGLTVLGLGIGSLAVPSIANSAVDNLTIPLVISGVLLTAGAVSLGLADDKANLVKWQD
jgi:hypothetical protein